MQLPQLRYLRHVWLLGFSALLAVSLVGCRKESLDTQPEDTQTSLPVWASFEGGDGSFTVDLPGVPRRDETALSDNTVLESMRANSDNVLLTVSWSDYTADGLAKVTAQSLLGSLAVSTASTVGAAQPEVSVLSLGDHPGVEVYAKGKLEGEPAELRGRLFLVDNRLYQLIVTGPVGETGQPANHIFSTFALEGKELALASTDVVARNHAAIGTHVLWPVEPEDRGGLRWSAEWDGHQATLVGAPLSPLADFQPHELARRLIADAGVSPTATLLRSGSPRRGFHRFVYSVDPDVAKDALDVDKALARVVIRPGLAVVLAVQAAPEQWDQDTVDWLVSGASMAAETDAGPVVWEPWASSLNQRVSVLFPGTPGIKEPDLTSEEQVEEASLNAPWPDVNLRVTVTPLKDTPPADFVAEYNDSEDNHASRRLFAYKNQVPAGAGVDLLVLEAEGRLVRRRVVAWDDVGVVLTAEMDAGYQYGETVERFMRSVSLGDTAIWTTQQFPSLRTAMWWPGSPSLQPGPGRARVTSDVPNADISLVVQHLAPDSPSRVPEDGSQPVQGVATLQTPLAATADQPAGLQLKTWTGLSHQIATVRLDADANGSLTTDAVATSLGPLDTGPPWTTRQPKTDEGWLRVAPTGYRFSVEMPRPATLERTSGKSDGLAARWQHEGIQLSIQARWIRSGESKQNVVRVAADAFEESLGAPAQSTEIKRGTGRGRFLVWDNGDALTRIVIMADETAWYVLSAVVRSEDIDATQPIADHFLSSFTID